VRNWHAGCREEEGGSYVFSSMPPPFLRSILLLSFYFFHLIDKWIELTGYAKFENSLKSSAAHEDYPGNQSGFFKGKKP